MSDWKSCSVVRDMDGDPWGRTATNCWILFDDGAMAETDTLAEYGPLTPVLDTDGLPVVTTVGDLTARHIGRRVRVGGEWDVEIVVGQVLHLIQAADGKPRTDIVDQRYEMADLRDPFIPFWSDTPCEVLDA